MHDDMPDAELIQRVQSYRAESPSNRGRPVCVRDILEIAGCDRADYQKFMKGEKHLSPSRRRRLIQAVVWAETGCITKANGILYIGKPTKQMQPRMRVDVLTSGPKLTPAARPQRSVLTLPSFKDAFSRSQQ